MKLRMPNWFDRGQSALLLESLVWVVFVAAIHAGVATVADWGRFEPEGFEEYWYIILHRWDFVPDYMLWIGLPLVVVVLAHSRIARRQRPRAQGGDEYRILDLHLDGPRSSIETFVYLYLGAMVMAGIGRAALVRCVMRGECDLFTWCQALLYSPIFLIWPLVLLLLRHALWKMMRRR